MAENINDHITLVCPDCGCVSFQLLKSGWIECADCEVTLRGVHFASCSCVNVAVGSYANQVSVINPFTRKWVCIDRCILPTVLKLWTDGINTIESCCGHGKDTGYIAVVANGIDYMHKEGFAVDEKANYGDRVPDIFKW